MTALANLTPLAQAVLAATPTGHEPCQDALEIARDLDMGQEVTAQGVAAVLGRLRALGLVERDSTGNTWSRYDSDAPGLDEAQAVTLAQAERTRPCGAQAEALETFGPAIEGQAVPGISPRPDLPDNLARVARAVTPDLRDILDGAREAQAAGLFHRAAHLVRLTIPHYAGHTRRARALERAQALEARAQAAETDARAAS